MPDVLECRKNVQKEECAIKRNETDPRDRQYEPDPSEQAQKRRKKAKKPNRGLRVAAVLLTIVLALEGLYCFVVFTDIPAIKSLREAYIETAMNTLSHQWLAKWFLPSYMIDEVVARQDQARKDQEGKISTWDNISASDATDKNGETVAPTEPTSQTDEERFYELFWELDRISFEDYVSAHPDVTANGWDNIYINEAGLNDDGTDIYTAMGERVLAVDAKNKILLVRVEGSGYQGVLAIAKDPSQLYNAPSAYIGSWGQQLEAIASAHDAVLGMTGSGFIDPDGNGSGGELAGYAMSQGASTMSSPATSASSCARATCSTSRTPPHRSQPTRRTPWNSGPPSLWTVSPPWRTTRPSTASSRAPASVSPRRRRSSCSSSRGVCRPAPTAQRSRPAPTSSCATRPIRP